MGGIKRRSRQGGDKGGVGERRGRRGQRGGGGYKEEESTGRRQGRSG